MMYNNKFVASIKCDDKILREQGDTVYLPFGSEYSITMKNLENRKALVHITIDGENVLGGMGLVVDSNETVTLERFFNRENKFKFIEKTEKISEHRGDRVDDGIVRISFKFEKEPTPYVLDDLWKRQKTYYDVVPTYIDMEYTTSSHTSVSDAILRQTSAPILSGGTSTSCLVSNNTSCDGITVPGSYSEQTFQSASIGMLEYKDHVIVLQLKGVTEYSEQVVVAPVTTRQKIQCPTCGTRNKSSAKFCAECGTALF